MSYSVAIKMVRQWTWITKHECVDRAEAIRYAKSLKHELGANWNVVIRDSTGGICNWKTK